ncbi:TolC family protein [Porphyromonas loveana]|uniref:TolC family protein n=1 Tax=Porphyromonas loveana TaxID=1884669 RepID=UPI0035A140A1
MKTILISLMALLLTSTLSAQKQMGEVLQTIESNNSTLKALRETTNAEKLNNRTGIFLDNPEVGFNYLWGNPKDLGKRTDFSITQSFDIATLTGMKNRVSRGQNDLLEWQYKAERMNIMLEAKQCCIELIYTNALLSELKLRQQHAQTIATVYETRLQTGDANRIEYNKAKLNLATAEGEYARIRVEREALLMQLRRLNGGIDIAFDDSHHVEVTLPDFDSWFAVAVERSPMQAYARKAIDVSKQQVALMRASGLPSFTAGYMSEKVAGEQFQGLTFGISIPLWENKNRVRQAKASLRAAQMQEADSREQLHGRMRMLYARTAGLKAAAESYRKTLEATSNADLLKKALDAGEISLLDYILELGLYYDAVNQALEAERDYQLAFAELTAFEL